MLRRRGREDARPRRPRSTRCSLHASRHRRPADAARPRLDHDRPLSHLPRRAPERQHGARSGQTTLATALSPSGLSDWRLRRRVRPRRALGAQPGLRLLRRPVRHEEVQAPRPGRRAAPRQRGDGLGAALAGGPQGARPFFAWIHLYDAHSPYEPPEPLRSRFVRGAWPALYDGEIAFADQQVARLVAWLEKAGLDQKTDPGRGRGPRRGPGQPRRGDARLLRLRLRPPRPVHRRRLPSTSCAACGSTRRSASSTSSRPCSLSPASIPRPRSTAARCFP